jgi:hypothetical protein
LKLSSIEQSRRGELLYHGILLGEISMKAHGNRPSSTIVFYSGPRMTRARNFRSFGALAGFSGPVKKKSLSVNQSGGKII